jgi:hypothetical protein
MGSKTRRARRAAARGRGVGATTAAKRSRGAAEPHRGQGVRPTVPESGIGRPASFSFAFFLLVALFAYLYFGTNGMYRPLALHSGNYLRVAALTLLSRDPAPRQFALDLGQPRVSGAEYGAGPVRSDARGRYLAVTSPVLRLTAPRLASASRYTVSLTVATRLARPARLSLLLGDRLRGDFTVKGDGRPEEISWVVPGTALSAGAQALTLAASWGPFARLAPGSDQAVWLNLYSLRISPQPTSY